LHIQSAEWHSRCLGFRNAGWSSKQEAQQASTTRSSAAAHIQSSQLEDSRDGSEAFVGGTGRDALIFGSTDRESVPDPTTGVRLPTLLFGEPGFPQGIPTANVSGLANFCTLEESPSPGYDFLVRFRGTTGNIIVTVRVSQVEQVFCSQDGSITFADLTQSSPAFVPVSQQEVENLNALVGAMVR
jgi:hypothetical protein